MVISDRISFSVGGGKIKSLMVSPSEADVAFGIGLSVWGISEAKAKKLISRPLGFASVE